MTAVQKLEKHLEEGRVYRRNELSQWSNAIDRHLKVLQAKGVLKKLSGGLYYKPKKTVFGAKPSPEKDLIKAFLKDQRFLVTNFNLFNSLGLGTTQLYNETLVYNHKRHGQFNLGGRTFTFKRINAFPAESSYEFLFVDLLNNLTRLAEDQSTILANLRKKIQNMSNKQKGKLARNVRHYGGARARKFFAASLNDTELLYGA